MNAKKVVGTLLLKPAFTQRNITSVLLVAAFFGVYILMGGTISTELPANRANGGFGGSSSDKKATASKGPDVTASKAKPSSAAELLGVKRSAERVRRERASFGPGLFSKEEREELEEEPLDPAGLVTGIKKKKSSLDRRLDKIENRRKNTDALSAIEERLNINHGK